MPEGIQIHWANVCFYFVIAKHYKSAKILIPQAQTNLAHKNRSKLNAKSTPYMVLLLDGIKSLRKGYLFQYLFVMKESMSVPQLDKTK